jgi:hypothetical protein
MIATVVEENEQIKHICESIRADPWRIKAGYSPDIARVNESLWSTSDKTLIKKYLLGWLAQWQPCLFGRLAARYPEAISMCILLEEELASNNDDWIRDHIQEMRRGWTKAGFEGTSSSFIVILISQKLANSLPDDNMLRLARRVCSLYLLREDIRADTIYHDELFLEATDRQRSAWKWVAGVNYFAAAADGRWWQDHRIPGGIAFSVNSIGHFVKSRILASAETTYHDAIELIGNMDDIGKIDSLQTAMVWAMRTIHGASEAVSGKATYLVPRSDQCPASPIALPKHLKEYDHRYYMGYYHTDYTLPSLYFLPDVERPQLEASELDLTYLTNAHVDNPDYLTMGAGRRIRNEFPSSSESTISTSSAVLVDIDSAPRLVNALSSDSTSG